MSWCPNCRNEYVEGMTTCPDCKCELTHSLEEENMTHILLGEQDFLEELNAFLVYNSLPEGEIRYNDDEEAFELFAENDVALRAKEIATIFLQQKALGIEEEFVDDMRAFPHISSAYQKKTERAEEVKASAITLIGVGAIGTIFIVLFELNILQVPMFGFSKHLATFVLGLLFIVFLYFGVRSLRSYKQLKEEGNKETKIFKELDDWCMRNLSKEKIDVCVFENDEKYPDEVVFFKRAEIIKNAINEQFVNLDEGFLEKFIDDEYSKIFES